MVHVELITDGLGVKRYRVVTICESEAEAAHVSSLLSTRKPPESFIPAIGQSASVPANEPRKSGEFDAMPPNCEGHNSAGEYRARLQADSASGDITSDACAAGVCGMGD